MSLPKLSPEELAEALDELARAAFVETFPHIPQAETIEADAASFIREAAAFLRAVIDEGGELADRATNILDRSSP